MAFSPFVTAIGLKDALPPNGVLLKYDILYKDERVAEHQMKAIPEGDLVRLEHTRHIDVKVLFISAFTERHHSTAWWTKQVILKKLEARNLVNGREVLITGHAQPNGFVFIIDGKEQKVPADAVTLDSDWVANFTYQGDFMSRGELEQDGNTIIYQRTSGP